MDTLCKQYRRPGSNPNNNNINMDVNDNIIPVQSSNDDLGVSVSQQMREKIINWEYVDLETLCHLLKLRVAVPDCCEHPAPDGY